MANSLVVCGGSADVGDNTTTFFPLSGPLVANATEARLQTPVRDGGVFSNLFVYCSANDIASATSATVTLMVSTVASALTISYGTSQTGIKEDTSNSVTVANTDELDYKVVATSVSGNHSITLNVIGVQFAPTTSGNCISFMVGSNGTFNFATASSTMPLFAQGNLTTGAAEVEALMQMRAESTFTATNLFANVQTNGRSTTTTVNSRKNGAGGGQTLSYTSGQTGQKEDTSGSDSLVVGDDFNYEIRTGTGTGNFLVNTCSTRWLSTANEFRLAGARADFTLSGGSTFYLAPSNDSNTPQSTEANAQLYPRFNMNGSRLSMYIHTNAGSSTVTVRTRVNGANGNQVLSYSTSQTGLKEDTTNTDSWVSGTDKMDYSLFSDPNSVFGRWIGMVGIISASPRLVGGLQAVKRASFW